MLFIYVPLVWLSDYEGLYERDVQHIWEKEEIFGLKIPSEEIT
jgi:hypothetical protein